MLVNNAGLDARGSILEAGAGTYREVFDANVLGTLLMIQAAVPAMLVPGGSIVNVAARSALQAVAGKSLYGAAKAAVVALTRTAALELAPGIRVNAVAPGPTDTPLLDSILQRAPDPQAAREAMTANVPLRRLATADEVARVILFLAGDQSSYLTGAVIPVDGGLSLWPESDTSSRSTGSAAW